MKLLNGSKWTHPGSSCFANLNSMIKVLNAIRSNLEGGEILVLNFVFQNLMLGRVDESQEKEEYIKNDDRLGKLSNSQKVEIIRHHYFYLVIQDTQIITGYQKILMKY